MEKVGQKDIKSGSSEKNTTPLGYSSEQLRHETRRADLEIGESLRIGMEGHDQEYRYLITRNTDTTYQIFDITGQNRTSLFKVTVPTEKLQLEYSIGRDPNTNRIVIPEPEDSGKSFTSNDHATLTLRFDGEVRIADHSTNGMTAGVIEQLSPQLSRFQRLRTRIRALFSKMSAHKVARMTSLDLGNMGTENGVWNPEVEASYLEGLKLHDDAK